MRKTVLTIAIVAGLTVPAYAGSCNWLMTKIDAALESAELSEADLALVIELREQGEQLHTDGIHAESVRVLKQALEILGV